jgi:predicted MPP superfamily phosphohydrolase
MPETNINSPIRLLHLSDIHFRAGKSWDQEPVLRDLTQFIADEAQKGLTPDLVVITGDLAFAGMVDEYQLAQDWLEKFWQVLPVDFPRNHLLLVPGNHDVNRKHVSTSVQFIQNGLLAENSQNTIAELLKGGDERDLVFKRHAAYLDFLGKWLGEPQPLPWWQRVIEIRGTRVHVAGLDSAWMAWREEDRSHLLLGRYQINQTVNTEDSKGVDWCIALLHHPWDYLDVIDSNESRGTIHQHCDLLLRGHLHETQAERIVPPDPNRACLELAAGCIYEHSRYPNAFQWIELHSEPRRVRVLFRAWVGNAWIIDRNQPGCPDGKADFDLTVVKKAKPVEDYDNIGDLDIYDSDIFIGREEQICDIENQLKNHRLVMLIGLGGIGKTRLITEIIKRKSEDAVRKEAIVFVKFEYVTIDSEDEVLDALVSHFKLAPTSAEDRLPALVTRLKDIPTLLVLDNCETAPNSIAKVFSKLIGRCRNVKILAASQHELGFRYGEVCRLPPYPCRMIASHRCMLLNIWKAIHFFSPVRKRPMTHGFQNRTAHQASKNFSSSQKGFHSR